MKEVKNFILDLLKFALYIYKINLEINSSSMVSRLYKPQPSFPQPSSAAELARKQAEEKAKKIMEEALKDRPDKPVCLMKIY